MGFGDGGTEMGERGDLGVFLVLEEKVVRGGDDVKRHPIERHSIVFYTLYLLHISEVSVSFGLGL